jgi:hypothetical protein
MEWFLKFIVIWFSIDVVIIATAWYAVSVIKPHFPNWWRQIVVDAEAELHQNPHAASGQSA